MEEFDVLQDIDFGAEVSENEDQLPEYFVETSVFASIVNDDHDLILGAKGTGKTAIFKILSDPEYVIPKLNGTIILPAFDMDVGGRLRRLMSRQTALSESAFRAVWRAHVACLIGNYLVDNFADTGELESLLTATQLRILPNTKNSILNSIVSNVKQLSKDVGVEAEVEIVGVRAKVAMNSSDEAKGPTEEALNFEDRIDDILDNVFELLCAQELRCWICYDRLDEMFADSRNIERAALRGLLRVATDTRNFSPQIRIKLFLRDDLFERITAIEGFVNLTHLRSTYLRWTRPFMAQMIADRVWRSEKFRAYFSKRNNNSLSKPSPTHILGTLLPRKMQYYTSDVKSGFVWAVDHMLDGTRVFNPRNIVALMNEAQRRQIEMHETKHRGIFSDALIAGDTLKRSTVTIGERRLRDTLYAEYSSLRKVIDSFRYGPRSYTGAKLQHLGSEIIDELTTAGFLERTGPRSYVVAGIYAAALGITIGGDVTQAPPNEQRRK